MPRIKITFDNYSSSSTRKQFIVELELEKDRSIRTEALKVIRQAQHEGLTDRRDLADKSSGIATYLRTKNITDASTGYSESGFGIKYSINKDGSIHVLNGYESLHHDWTLGELEELCDCGYINGNPYDIIVVLPSGLGASLQDLFDWFGFLSDIYGLSLPTVLSLRWGINALRYRKLRKIVNTWVKNGIRYPSQIREFIDTKSGWKLYEVKRRLKISDEYAIKLLYSLGLEPKNNVWQITHSKQSIANRKKWLRNEKRYAKSANLSDE